MRDRIAKALFNQDAKDGVSIHRHSLNYLANADQILALFTLPTVKVKCGKCGGVGGSCNHEMPLDCPGSANIIHCPKCRDHWTPCTCQNGEREYQRWWEKHNETDENDAIWVNYPKPLSYLDLADPDVAWAYRAIAITPSIMTCDIPNNKGRLVLRLKED